MVDRPKAPDDEMRTRRQLAEHVGSELPRAERESAFNHIGNDDKIDLTTYAKPWVRDLLKHDYASVEWVRLTTSGGRGERVDDLDDAIERARQPGGPTVEGLRARVPLGSFTIKGKPRVNDHLSGVVNTPAAAAAAADRFADAE